MSSTTNFVQSEFRYDEGKSPLALLAETCRNIGVDTTTSKLAKSSIDHVKSSNNSSSSSSSLSSSSSSSIESSSRKNNDSCRLSVSPLRNATPVTPTSRTSANSVTGSNTTTTNNNNTINSNNNSVHNVNINVSTASNHSSSSSTGSYIGNNVTTISNSESNGCSFKPYEDHIISKKKCPDETRIRSTSSVHDSDNKNRVHNNNNSKHYINNNNNSESVSKTYESNCLNKRENVKSSSSSNVSNIISPSSSSSSTTSSTSSTNCTSSNTTSTSTAHVNRSSPSKGSNCNGCLPPHQQSSTPHSLTVDNVSKYVPYPSLSPYLGLPPPPPTGYDPASVAAVAAAVAGHCHSPSMCRDPFCAGCRFNAAANVLGHHQVSACPAGCTQCSHVTSQMTTSMSHQIAALQANGYLPGNAFYPPPPHHQHQQHQHHQHHHPGNPPTSSANSPHATSAAAAAAAASNANGKPNICSWMIGNTYCGKRFTSSEELHQHLRNHTSSDPTSVSALAFLGQYPHLDPMLTSPIAGLRRTAFDPVNRYHPYKSLTNNGSPLSTLTNGLTGPMHKPPPGSQLNMHYPPYGPYTGRLGPPILP
ncbi:uncharacterized protein DDB_G0271670-like [Panonychus citri]|uniref:uncharacterized protein DDB_G0271670-like n=1 Tax=Panonychus citri TaxID=50023 RepID=UPI002307AF83|nr:uncharacterized protein DDB_G0271670-like [Panonychus citri]